MSPSFGGEHMSAAAVPPSIGSDCVLANSLPGSRANSEASELSRFSENERLHSTWFTRVARFSLSWRPFTLDTWCPGSLFYLDKSRWWGWNTQHSDLWLEQVWHKSLRWHTFTEPRLVLSLVPMIHGRGQTVKSAEVISVRQNTCMCYWV